MHIILTAICGLLNLYAKKFRCPDVLTSIVVVVNLWPDFHRLSQEYLHMTRKQATIAVRSGLNDDEQYGCVVPPIHLSSTYNFTGFNEPRAHDYSRRGNPTRDVVQRALAELEGGAGAVLTNTGMSAIHLVTTVFLKPGDLLVAPHDCYGGSYRLFDSLATRGCYRVRFVDQGDERALQAALEEKPKLVLVESPSNPLLRVVDIAKICRLAREAGAVSVVDNTFLSPALQNPLALGADLVLHSCTKYLNGHSDVVAGVVIAKDPEVVTELAWWANNIGVTGGAFDSYLLLRGLRTLVPRMELAQRNAQAIVKYLQTQPLVKKLYHPSLPENQGHEIAARQQKGFGAMLSFELDGDEETLRRFLGGLSLFTLAESLGGVESLISHAATMTHAGMSPQARAAAGISETLLRISTGIEDGEDLIADLENGFRAANKG
ncbi:cystathionine gamma-synthase [Salmonella enterica subsp. enterica serovar Enteritidis str. 2010K-0262]|uniref:Cystathionine gamma-synthase n=80 Tax=Salmonella TaxID=590 RepID=M7S1L0_SALDU|nr:cystathionine gamma-synthase [Salmonella enterica subsp. enterica serovar Heidelberg str. CFSAN002064]EMR52021.1 cystathionine gamma-synthase [Salmonella enterica subsp. enterica serovar Dublin str. UC16]EPI69876.1 cystathionine gamma-synthase [Salmonella enterica subsp. enterica serovar Dublin str. DG22]EPI74392.1 cystathionine gamma-synthase [Salmonella enterica subsp. enterica serovar Enteritidis str. 2009K0958]EPI76917.1 cystathionine gamma-synthase [Salmonella enterica subsp. enterica s